MTAAPAAAQTTVTVGCSTTALVQDLLTAYNTPGTTETLSLATGCTYPIPNPSLAGNAGGAYYGTDGTPFDWYGPAGLPAIDGTITIDGNGATLVGGGAGSRYRLLYVGADPSNPNTSGYTSPGAGSLTLKNLAIQNFDAQGGSAVGSGGGAGMGGAIFNEGATTLNGVTATGNVAQGGASTGSASSSSGGGGIGTDGSTIDGSSGGFGPGSFGGAAGGAGDATDMTNGGGGGFATTDVGQPGTALGGGNGGGAQTGLGGSSFTGVGVGGDGAGGGGPGGTGSAGGAFGQGSSGGGGGVGGGGSWVESGGGGFGAGGGAAAQGGFGGGGGDSPSAFPNSNGGFGGGAGGLGSGATAPGGGGAGMGGVVFNMQGTVTVTNSTFAHNSALGGAAAGDGAQSGSGLGGAIFNLNGSVMVTNATFDSDVVSSGVTDIYDLVYDSAKARTANVTVTDSVLTGAGGLADAFVNDPANTLEGANAGSMAPGAPNLGSATLDISKSNYVGSSSSAGTGTLTGSSIAGAPNLKPLASNGGPGMQTELPGTGSNLVGHGTCVQMTDERGTARPGPGGQCDIGAVEVAAAPVCTGVSASVLEGGSVQITFTCTAETAFGQPGSPAHGTLSSFDPNGGTVTYAPNRFYYGSDSFTFTGTDSAGASWPVTATINVIRVPVPVLNGAPAVSGTAKSGRSVRCLSSWSGSPTGYTYHWARLGTPIQGVTGSSYRLQRVDQGTSLTCTVVASNAGGSGTAAISKAFSIPVPAVSRCPAASGSASGSTLGLLHLGMTRVQAGHAYRRSSTRASRYMDLFCLTPYGVRAGYESPRLQRELPGSVGRHDVGRVVWASTQSARYAIARIRVGATIAAVQTALPKGTYFRFGANSWYFASVRGGTLVLRVRAGVVQEIGIALSGLTGGQTADRVLLTYFQ